MRRVGMACGRGGGGCGSRRFISMPAERGSSSV